MRRMFPPPAAMFPAARQKAGTAAMCRTRMLPTSEHFAKRAASERRAVCFAHAPLISSPTFCFSVMTSMYCYPRVPRCDPSAIQLPASMYRMNPVGHKVTEGTSGSSVQEDDRSFTQILSAQERLISRLQRIEDGFVRLCGVESISHNNETEQSKSGSSGNEGDQIQSENPDQSLVVASILQRQEKLIQQIDQLAASLQKAVVTSPVKDVDVSQITRQIATDVAIFVEMGTSIRQLYCFFLWLRDEKKLKVLLRTHYHSSTLGLGASSDWDDFSSPEKYWRAEFDVTVTLIVTRTAASKQQVRSFIDPAHGVVAGEEQIVRLLANKLAVDYDC